jgi:hypothetical protein
MAEIQRASVFAIKEESVAGSLESPSAGADFIPLRSGFTLEPGLEELDSDELVNSIGASKSTVGKESPTGAHNAYLKHSESEGVAPEYGLLIESSLGGKDVLASEKSTTAGSTASAIELGAGGADYRVGHAVLIKDGANPYQIRNVASKSGDTLTPNFNLDNAPASGVSLGVPVLYYPTPSGHKSYSAFLYSANGAAVQAVAGARTSSMSLAMTSGQFAEINFSYAGSEYFYNPVIVDSSNNKIDFTDDLGAVVATLTNGVYKTPIDFAEHVASVMTQASVGSGNDTISVSYSSSTGKYTLSSDGTTFELDFQSGPNTANTAAGLLGFDVADETGATSYESDSALDLSAPFTPDYDDADNIVVKSAELMIGDADDNFCREASTVSFSIETPPTDVDDICSQSGVKEKLILSRQATMSATLTLKKYEVDLFNKYIKGESAPVMMNIGPKSGGNWVAGKCVNIYLANATLNAHTVAGDEFIIVEVSAKAFVTGDNKEVFINFV